MNFLLILAALVNLAFSQGEASNWMNMLDYEDPRGSDPLMDAMNMYSEDHIPAVYEKRSKWMRNRMRPARH
ncbi:Oidioi.mRNA.OKI2018_I69.PAR.g9222.t1.cds [Oikopleura dioica]|uniref:Oidioi.mRNA.OKI2018_I69.PAR.g9222.t1.cds n=1 Tax=Oikopleura dioica TaxID=34765 RepID=A0ABN7RN55_OIKDI|nr:Oidioi.mRNA.OKI2018_I69.PAR.g9222.t1.cds [Oikopleura dioica]